MFKRNNPSYKPFDQLLKSEFYKRLKQHWMRALVLGGLCFIVLKKDVQIQLNLTNAVAPVTVEGGAMGEAAPVVQASGEKEALRESRMGVAERSPVNQFAIIDPVNWWKRIKATVSAGKAAKANAKPNTTFSFAPAQEQPVQETKVASNTPVANTFSNLTFVLSPSYAKRKGIPDEVVQEKLDNCKAYILRFAPVAVAEKKKYGVPASIKLAQALLESNAGDSRLSRQNNNHFGIKCFQKNCAKDHCGNFTDDSHKDFFRKYTNSWESFRAHSLFLQGKRYASLKNLPITDYKAWARGLKKAGYATDAKYAEKLIRIIEFFELQMYD